MQKVAVVVPVHPPKKKYALNLAKSFRKQNTQYIDLYFIYTNKDDEECFKKMNDGIQSILLPSDIDHSEIEKRNLYPIFKKLYAVYLLSKENEYEFIITVDSESLFLDLSNIYDVCKSFRDKKEVYGNQSDFQKYNKICKTILKQFDKSFKTIDTSIYFFFSQIPIYESKIANEFFKFIQFEKFNQIISMMNWETFEYPLYYYYCVHRHGYKVVDLAKYGIDVKHSLECRMTIAIKTILDDNDIDINWQAIHHITLFNAIDKKICMLYHLDRGAGQKKKAGCIWSPNTHNILKQVMDKYT